MDFVQDFDSLAWTGLLAQVAGVVLGAALLVGVLRRAGRPLGAGAGVAVVALVAAAWLLPPTLRGSARDLAAFGRSNDARVESERDRACETQALIDTGFVDWLRGGAPWPRDARYHLVVSKKTKQLDGQFCMRYDLLPRVQVADREDAQWVLFYEDLPGPEVEFVARRCRGVPKRNPAGYCRYLVPDPENADRTLVRLPPRGR